MLRRLNKMQPPQSNLNFPDFPPFFLSSSAFIETRAFKINLNNENWDVLPYSTTKMPISILIEKKVMFSHAYRGSSRSFHSVTTHVKPPGSNNWTEESVNILARQ